MSVSYRAPFRPTWYDINGLIHCGTGGDVYNLQTICKPDGIQTLVPAFDLSKNPVQTDSMMCLDCMDQVKLVYFRMEYLRKGRVATHPMEVEMR